MKTIKIRTIHEDEAQVEYKKSVLYYCKLGVRLKGELFSKAWLNPFQCRRIAKALNQAADEMESKK